MNGEANRAEARKREGGFHFGAISLGYPATCCGELHFDPTGKFGGSIGSNGFW